MQNMNRRHLFKLAGAGSIAAVGIALPVVSHAANQEANVFGFRATLGLPEPPLPNYATYVIDGTVDLVAKTGLVTSRVLAGHPGDPSEIGLPGLTRVIRVVDVSGRGSQLTLRGLVEDRSQLQPAESPQAELRIDRERGIVDASFVGRPVTLAMS
jgi:hypothetical protein